MGISFCLDLSVDESKAMGKFGDIGLARYSQAQESAADEWGLRLLEQAGFDIREGPKIFDIMDQYDKSKETPQMRQKREINQNVEKLEAVFGDSKEDSAVFNKFMGSHPKLANRVQALEEQLVKLEEYRKSEAICEDPLVPQFRLRYTKVFKD